MKKIQDTYRAAGKLMLFGEYLVLEGAQCLAFPLKFGQSLSVEPNDEIDWESHDQNGCWFKAHLNNQLEVTSTNNPEIAEVLQNIFQQIRQLKAEKNLNARFKVVADFNLQWGLGSSSTLISLLSQWADVDPYQLMESTFGGSAYDVACAKETTPLLYSVTEKKIANVSLSKVVTEKMLFVYLGQKQNSRNEIKKFQRSEVKREDVREMNQIIQSAVHTDQIEVFENCMNQSEDLLAKILGREKLKARIFADYKYSVKSLGAWGGDFFLATFRDLKTAKTYFANKGLTTMFTYNELIRNGKDS